MDHVATMRRCYELINAGDLEGFGRFLADDFIEHEETPGLEPTKEGVLEFFRLYKAAFPDLRFVPEDFIAEGDKVVVRVRASGTHNGDFMGCPLQASRSTCSSSTSFASRMMASGMSTGASPT